MKQVRAKDSVYAIASSYPEVVDILVDFGFTQIKQPKMLQSVGRIMTLEKGCNMRGFDYEKLKKVLYKQDYEVIE